MLLMGLTWSISIFRVIPLAVQHLVLIYRYSCNQHQSTAYAAHMLPDFYRFLVPAFWKGCRSAAAKHSFPQPLPKSRKTPGISGIWKIYPDVSIFSGASGRCCAHFWHIHMPSLALDTLDHTCLSPSPQDLRPAGDCWCYYVPCIKIHWSGSITAVKWRLPMLPLSRIETLWNWQKCGKSSWSFSRLSWSGKAQEVPSAMPSCNLEV